MGAMKKLYTANKKPYIRKDENGEAEEVVDDDAVLNQYRKE